MFAPGSALPVDTRVDIEIDGEEHVGAVLVPADAILKSGNETVVLVAAGNRAERRVVTTGLPDADSVEIVSGVEAGELVITRGQSGLADGAPISVSQISTIMRHCSCNSRAHTDASRTGCGTYGWSMGAER